jgi:hypothetical protein
MVSENVNAPFATPSGNTPEIAVITNSRPFGNVYPNSHDAVTIIAPDKVNRDASNTNGGNDSSDIRIPRYVVPQKKHTAANAT